MDRKIPLRVLSDIEQYYNTTVEAFNAADHER
jgi:hypothetical protein